MPTQFLTQPDGVIAYDDMGAGPLVICIPSMGDLRTEYRFLAPQLVAAGHRVLTMDVRGHGESSTGWPDYTVGAIGSDIVALIRSLAAGPATIVGASMAAGAAVWAAAEAPELVSRLVLIGPFVRGETGWANRLLYSAPLCPTLGAIHVAALLRHPLSNCKAGGLHRILCRVAHQLAGAGPAGGAAADVVCLQSRFGGTPAPSRSACAGDHGNQRP